MAALLIPVEGEPRLLYDADRPPTLDEAQLAVGGWVEKITFRRETWLVQEEGRVRGAPENPRATQMYWDRARRSKRDKVVPVPPGGALVGPVLLLEGRARWNW
jgi:hypothetical protein